jgi:hypothetical protein
MYTPTMIDLMVREQQRQQIQTAQPLSELKRAPAGGTLRRLAQSFRASSRPSLAR